MDWLLGKKIPQPFPGGDPDSEEEWRLQEERIAKEKAQEKAAQAAQEAANKGVLSNVSDTLGKLKFWGGRRPKKPTKKKPKKQTKKQTKNKRN